MHNIAVVTVRKAAQSWKTVGSYKLPKKRAQQVAGRLATTVWTTINNVTHGPEKQFITISSANSRNSSTGALAPLPTCPVV